MANEQQQPGTPFEWVDTPQTEPIRVRGRHWQQGGYEVISAPCPKCQPGMKLDANLLGMHVHVNQPGRIICRCGAYLELYVEEGS